MNTGIPCHYFTLLAPTRSKSGATQHTGFPQL